ncbi:MAG TPA: ROK family protein [Candidatus Limnocylindrales bacterium]
MGGTQIRAAAIQSDGTRLARVARPTPSEDGPRAVVLACLSALRAVRDDLPDEVRGALAGVGISSPGPVDPRAGVIVEPPNLGPDFHDVPIVAEVERDLGLTAYLDRDTNVAALGEQTFGAGRGCLDFLYVTVSTGVGGAVVSGGNLIHGPDGMAGEIGHVPVALAGPVCGCGGVAHLEAFASGAALAREARAAADSGASPYLAGRVAERGLEELDARDVADGEDAGDAHCHELMETARHAFAVACVGLTNLFNPSRIVVGGSIAQAQGDRLLEPARREVAANAFSRPAARVRIVPATLGPDVSLAGALPLVSGRLGDLRRASGTLHSPSQPGLRARR